MTDLIVTSRPISEPPLDVVTFVTHMARSSSKHVTHTGRNDRIERPARDGVALFWRFMIEKLAFTPHADRRFADPLTGGDAGA
jgi:hypothetical protein